MRVLGRQGARSTCAPDVDYTKFYGRGGAAATLIVVGLYLVPFAGIACLWHTIATRTLLQLAAAVVFVCGVRAAGLYVITTTGPARTAELLPRPLALPSYLLAGLLLVSTTFHPAVLLVFPAWVLLVSVVLLVHRPSGEIR
jgi:hypothetical protein